MKNVIKPTPATWEKSRAAQYNPVNRYQSLVVDREVLPPPPRKTTLTRQNAGRILATNRSPDVPFDQSINPYRGCEHGCIYCFARPTHAFLDLSPGVDFETQIFAKSNAAERLRAAFDRRNYRCKPIGLGTNTDPYQQVEKSEELTRQILEVCLEYRNPVTIVTKSHLVLRDLDLLKKLAARNLVEVSLSVTTLDPGLKRLMEPRAPGPTARLQALRALSNAGIPTGVLVAPVIPRINDHELEAIVKASKEHGANAMGFVMLRLPLEVKELFEAWLEQHFPDRADAVMNAMRSMHGGQAYRSNFGSRGRGTGRMAEMIRARFEVAIRRFGVQNRQISLDTDQFRRPGDDLQLALFG